jgi:hypothetical protein
MVPTDKTEAGQYGLTNNRLNPCSVRDIGMRLLLSDVVLQVRNAADLTGTKITSSNEIVVLSGTEWTPISHAAAQSIGAHIAMQLSPVNEWGQLFLSSPLDNVQSADAPSMRLLGWYLAFFFIVYLHVLEVRECCMKP